MTCNMVSTVPSLPETGGHNAFANGFTMPPRLRGVSGLESSTASSVSWLWKGYLAPGATTLLTSQWKSGKTTLASVLLAKLKAGGALAGLPVGAGHAVVVSEEDATHWRRRASQLDFGDHVSWYCQPFRGKPRFEQWLAFLEGLGDLHAHEPFALLVIDPLAAFLPGHSENSAASLLDTLNPLRELSARGLAILMLHHPGRAARAAGQMGRGSTALSGFADILIEMRFNPHGSSQDRSRRLQAFSRFPETPRDLMIEWTADGTDYIAQGDFADAEYAGLRPALITILASADEKLTRADLLERWPAPAPDKNALGRCLQRAVADNLVRRDGRGQKANAYRYWLPHREAQGRDDPMTWLRMPELFQEMPVSRFDR